MEYKLQYTHVKLQGIYGFAHCTHVCVLLALNILNKTIFGGTDMLWNLLNPDNGLARAINKITDMILLSLLWVLLCCTVIGIGPATVGLYYAVAKSIRRDRGSVLTEFFHAIKQNWKISLIIGILLTAFGLSVLFFDIPNIVAFFTLDDPGSLIWTIFSFLKIFVFIGISLYVFPMISRYNVTTAGVVLTSLLLSLKHIFSTLSMCAIVFAGAYVIQFHPLWLGIVPACVVYILTFFLEPILKTLMSEQDKANMQDDPWYLE